MKFNYLYKFSSFYKLSDAKKDKYLLDQQNYINSPFIRLDKYNGYSNYGYYKSWLIDKIPNNCKYIYADNIHKIINAVKEWNGYIIVKNM